MLLLREGGSDASMPPFAPAWLHLTAMGGRRVLRSAHRLGAYHRPVPLPDGVRERRSADTHERILDAALELFLAAGYMTTTIDDIAKAAGIGRRTFFRYFPSKEAILFGDLLARQRWALDALRARPQGEAPLASLLAVFTDLCKQPIDANRRARVRSIVQSHPDLQGIERRVTVFEFEEALVDVLKQRHLPNVTEEALRVLTSTAMACVESAWRVQISNGRTSLAAQFSSMIDVCTTHWGQVFAGDGSSNERPAAAGRS